MYFKLHLLFYLRYISQLCFIFYIFNVQFSCIFKFFSNIITLHHNNLYHSNVIVFKWIYEHTIDASYFALCSGISPDQISIAKPGFPKVTYAPLERQTCIVERKAGDRNSSRGILSQACVSVWSVYMRAIEDAECISRRGCTLRITWIWIKVIFLASKLQR